jgi:hypothetical protein
VRENWDYQDRFVRNYPPRAPGLQAILRHVRTLFLLCPADELCWRDFTRTKMLLQQFCPIEKQNM